MKQKMKTVEVWVLVNEEGGYDVGCDANEATERFEENVGECNSHHGIRTVKITLTVPLPTCIDIAATVPADEAEATVRVE